MKTYLKKTAAMGVLLLAQPTVAHAGNSVDVSADLVTEYIFRGIAFDDEAFQPGIEFAFGDFAIGAWSSIGIGSNGIKTMDELDLYAGSSFALNDSVSADVGVILYHFPEQGGLFDIGTDAGDGSTLEFYGGISLDTFLSPAATVYYDINLEALTLEGGIAHSFPLQDNFSLDLGLTAGHVSVDGDGDYEWGHGSAALTLAVSESISAYVGANYGINSEKLFTDYANGTTKTQSSWFGAGVATGF